MDSNLYPLLSRIQDPMSLNKLSLKELQEVAQEIRQAIIDQVSKTGGHFSSNLGVVELTVALYAAYRLPEDQVVWDTGHQAYAHKMLTGRLDRFETLRKYQGLSGFLRRDESPYDVFGAGHAGTAISAALGLAKAKERTGDPGKVVAVTGDSAISSGMSWEALNHAGELETDLTVVLNDNRMSIAPNVGALKNYLAKLRSRPQLQSLAQAAKQVVEKMPDPMTRVAAGLRHGITHYLAPHETGTIFEEIGFEYIGPVDGHDLPTLLEVFRNVRELSGPVFVHAITVKGKGYEVAEEDSRKWHGVAPFSLETQQLPASAGPVVYTQAFGAAAIEAAEKDDKIVAITAAMPDGTGLNGFAQKFPERYYDVGIAEQHAVTFAAGLAAGGLKPFVAIYSTFLQRGFDQVLHDVCLQNLPVRFFMDRAGLVGDDGPTHHGAFDLSFLSFIPNLAIAAPRDTTELREMVDFAADYDDGPLAIRYPRGASDDRLPESRTPVQLGQAEVLAQGEDVALIAIGSMVGEAWEARRLLNEQGLQAGVVNARWIKPLDVETLARVAREAKAVVVIEENAKRGGFGEAVRDALIEISLGDRPIKIIALPDQFIEHGTQAILRKSVGLDAASIAEAASRLLSAVKR